MMKTMYILYMALWLSVVGSLFASCSEDYESQWNPETSNREEHVVVGDGQFVVNYSATDGLSTRALSDKPLPANERISSLHYYVYDKETGNLVKKRQIRGINRTTTWPINNRISMSWELRQDLQDTLMVGPTYRILFIANIDSTLFALPDGKPHPAVVRYDKKYESAQILLPEVPFSDHNMYYLWEGELKAQDQATIKCQDVLLQRLVTRTDIHRMEIPNWNKHLELAIDSSLYVDTVINAKVDAHITSFCQRMTEQITGKYKDYATRLRNLLTSDTVRLLIKDSLKHQLISQYHAAIFQTDKFKKRMTIWPVNGIVSVYYQKNTRANVLTFSRTPMKDPTLKQMEELEVLNGNLSIIGFSGNETINTNGIDSLVFTGTDPTVSFTIDGKTLWLKEGMNRRFIVTCNPLAGVDSREKESFSPSVNFYNILKDNKEWNFLKGFDLSDWGGSFFQNVQEKVFDSKEGIGTDYSQYGKNFNEFLFSNILMPNIKNDNVKNISLIPSWNYGSDFQ